MTSILSSHRRVRTGRTVEPFRDVVIIGCGAAGLMGLMIPSARSNLIVTILPGFSMAWYVVLTVGALTVGASWFCAPLQGMAIERVGMIWLASLIVPFGVALVLLRGPGFIPSSLLVLTLGVACAARAWQITRARRWVDGKES